MRSLIWKDCRLNSWVLMLGVVTWLARVYRVSFETTFSATT
jgi:hypothetical protein